MSATDIAGRTFNSELYEALRDGPKTGDELPYYTKPSPGVRDLVCKIEATAGKKTENVYYLWGDDRRGVRKWIEVNESYLAGSGNPMARLQGAFDEALDGLFREELHYREAVAEEEDTA